MEAASSHCSMRFLAESSRRSLFSTSKTLISPWIGFFQASKKMSSSHAAFRSIRSVPSRDSSSLPSAPEGGEGIVEPRVKTTAYQSKTVHVRFVLQKECLFGQQLLLAGDDPMFGLWDPSNAIPLEWSDGHFWTAELDIPVGKSVQFKFILRGITGEINWQPGPDRILQMSETANTVVITEDWDDAENQKIEEREVNETQIATFEENPEVIITDERQLTSYEDLVLVPGLSPVHVSMNTSFFPEEVTKGKMEEASLALDEAMNCNASQLSEEQEAAAVPNGNEEVAEEETTALPEKLPDDEDNDGGVGGSEVTPSYDDVASDEKHVSENIVGDLLRSDIVWGQKALHQLLLNLGFDLEPPI